MKKILVNPDLCRGCRICRKGCPAGAIQIRSRLAAVGRQCILCGQCVADCPFHALSLWEGSQEEWDRRSSKTGS